MSQKKRRSYNGRMAEAEERRIILHRRVACIRPGRIDIRPGREAIVGPLIGVCIGVACFAAIIVFRDALPLPALALFLLFAVLFIPLAGMGLVYSLFGTNIVADVKKNSIVFHQSVTGLGIGTREVVPFEKIVEFVVEEAGEDETDAPPTEEFTQWQVTLVKTSGRRLRLAGMTAWRSFEMGALAPVVELGRALADLTQKPLALPDVSEDALAEEVVDEPA